MSPCHFKADRTYYFAFARVALLEGLKLLNLKKDDVVLLPAFICNSVLAPFNYLGIKVKYYAVDGKLNPIAADVKKQIDVRTRAIMVVNYFGFPAEIKEVFELCKNSGIFLIEDNAHGFLSKQGEESLGSWGDIAIVSFRKTIMVPNGAALLVNAPFLSMPVIAGSTYAKIGNLTYLRAYLLDNFEKFFKFNIRSLCPRQDCDLVRPSPPEEEHNIDEYFIQYSPLAKFILNQVSVEKVIGVRRINYLRLLDFFKHQAEFGKPFVGVLPDGVVPYAFPVLVKDPLDFIKLMLTRGVRAWPWPALPLEIKQQEHLPDFYKCLVLVPVDKEINL